MRLINHPKGAIRSQAELQDTVTEARRSKKAIRLFHVSQGGNFGELFLTSKSKIFNSATSPEIYQLSYYARSIWSGKRYYPSSLCLADNNITDKNGRPGGHNRHMLFTNRKHAEAYSEQLKNDKEYQRSVREWHEHCRSMYRFGGV